MLALPTSFKVLWFELVPRPFNFARLAMADLVAVVEKLEYELAIGRVPAAATHDPVTWIARRRENLLASVADAVPLGQPRFQD